MAKVSCVAAAQIVGVSDTTIRHDVKIGDLPATKMGKRGILRIEVEDLKKYAERFNREFREDLVNQLAN